MKDVMDWAAGNADAGKLQSFNLAPSGLPLILRANYKARWFHAHRTSADGDSWQRPLYVLNGPNLNMLGMREPEIYGHATLEDVEKLCGETAKRFGLDVDFRQSNHEGEMVDWIQEAHAKDAGVIVINPAGYTNTSIAILDALLAIKVPVIEVHITNIHKRESFRHVSYVSKVARAVIAGCGIDGYALAITALAGLIGAKAKGLSEADA